MERTRGPAPPWVVSAAVACLSGLKSAPRKRVRGNPPRVQIPPPPPTDKAKRWPRHKVGAGVRGLGVIFGLIWLLSMVRHAVWARPEQQVELTRHVAINRGNDVCVAADATAADQRFSQNEACRQTTRS